jgi:hypothetical protein
MAARYRSAWLEWLKGSLGQCALDLLKIDPTDPYWLLQSGLKLEQQPGLAILPPTIDDTVACYVIATEAQQAIQFSLATAEGRTAWPEGSG